MATQIAPTPVAKGTEAVKDLQGSESEAQPGI